MKPFIVLLTAFAISIIVTTFVYGNYEFALSARIAMSVMLVFTAIGLFAFNKGMTMMLPDFVPYKTLTVYITGVFEIAAAIGLFVPGFRIITAWFLIAFFLLILPANIYASIKNIDYQKGNSECNGPIYLWFRIPLQILFIVCTYLSSIKG